MDDPSQSRESKPLSAIPIEYAAPVHVPAKKSRPRLWLTLIFGGVVVAAVGGWFVFAIAGRLSQIESAVDAFQGKIDAADFGGAYRLADPSLRATTGETSFTEHESAVHQLLGELKEKSMGTVSFHEGSGTTDAWVTYGAWFEKGAAEVTYSLSKSTGRWRVTGKTVSSPAVTALLTCSKCGTVSAVYADRCGKCGANMKH